MISGRCAPDMSCSASSLFSSSLALPLPRLRRNVAAVYCLDSQFAGDPAKFVAGSLQVGVQLLCTHRCCSCKCRLPDVPGYEHLLRLAVQALSAMVQLEVPHVNVLTKMDLCKNKARRGRASGAA